MDHEQGRSREGEDGPCGRDGGHGLARVVQDGRSAPVASDYPPNQQARQRPMSLLRTEAHASASPTGSLGNSDANALPLSPAPIVVVHVRFHVVHAAAVNA